MGPDCGPKNGAVDSPKNKKSLSLESTSWGRRGHQKLSGEGEHHLGPEISNNISWPEMGTICMGRDSLTKKTYVNSSGNTGGPS